MSTYTHAGGFNAGSVGINGVGVSAFKASRFSSPPQKNDPLPGTPDATATTSSDFGFDGAYAIALPTCENYYIAVNYQNTIYWEGPIAQLFDDDTAGLLGAISVATKAVSDSSNAPASTAFVKQAIAAMMSNPVPSAPTLLSCVSGDSYVDLTFAAPGSDGGSPLQSYEVWRGTAPDGETLLHVINGNTIFTYHDPTSVNGTTYYFKVAARNSIGLGAFSNEMSSTPKDVATVPDPPTLVNAVASPGQVVTNFTPAPDDGGSALTSFEIWRGVVTGGESLLHAGIAPTDRSYTDLSVVNGTKYFYIAKSRNAVGISGSSNEQSATPSSVVGMTNPPGYTDAMKILDDKFPGTVLNASYWNNYLGANGGRWDDWGALTPYTGANDSQHGGQRFDPAIYTPAQVIVNNGLELKAQEGNTTGVNPLNEYTWMSGVVCTQGKVQLPAGGWYVQVRAKMPNCAYGAWPGIWFMPDAGSPTVEIDLHEGGITAGSSIINQAGHCNYFSPSGTVAVPYDAGVDLSADYHVYGCEFRPGVSVKFYFDGRLIRSINASDGVNIVAGTYEILLQLEIASGYTAGWHTPISHGSGPYSMFVSQVQAFHV
jgi:hypothetical protein